MSTEPAAWRVFDAHNDLVHELVARRGEATPFAAHWRECLRAGGVKVQVCPLHVWWNDVGDRGLRSGLEQITALMRAADENEDVSIIRSGSDLHQVLGTDGLGLVMAVEGAEAIGSDPGLLPVFHQLGVRMIGLTHFQRNVYADGNGETANGGLSWLGRDLVRRIAEKNIVLDLAHASDRTFDDALEIVEAGPVVVSHTASRRLFDTPRNVTDEQMRRIAAAGGVLGIFAESVFLGAATLDRYVDHLVHAVEVAGVDHVGIGADFTAQLHAFPGLVRLPPWVVEAAGGKVGHFIPDLRSPEHYPNLVDALQRRGLGESELRAVLFDNFLRVLRRALI